MRKVTCVLRGMLLLASTLPFFTPLFSHAQSNGDYRSAVATGNWNTSASWEKYNSGWAAATDYPGQNAGAGTVTIRDGHTITLNISPANAIGALTVGEGTSGSLTTDNSNRTLTVTNALTIAAGGSYNMNRTALTVNGTTSVSGSLTDGNNNGSGIFVGLFTVNNGGTFSTNNTSAFTFRGGIDNDGTFNKTGAGSVTFNTNSQDIDGSQAIVMNGTITITGVTVTNKSADLTLTRTAANAITGTGGWTQATNSVLKFSGASLNVASTDFDSNVNTFNYTRSGAQTVYPDAYHHLTVSTSGTKTLGGDITVNGNLDVSGSAVLACGVYQITGNATGTFTMASGTSLQLGNTGNATDVLFPTNFTSGNTTLNSASTVVYQNNATQTVSGTPTYGNLTVSTGGTKTTTGSLNVAGNLVINAGTLTLGASASSAAITGNGTLTGTFDLGTNATTVTVGGTCAVAGSLIFNGTSVKSVTISGNLSGAGTIDMSGGSLLHSLTLDGTNNAITTFTTAAVASTVTYNRSSAQQIFASANYRNMVLSNTSTKTIQGATTVNNNLTVSTGTTLNPAGQNLTVSGSTVIAGTLADATAAGTTSLQDLDLSGGTIHYATQTGVVDVNGNLTMPTGDATIGRVALTVSGTTTIPTGRALDINNNTGVKTFTGAITINGTGTWTSTSLTTTASLVIENGIINNNSSAGSFDAGGATFSTNSQSLAGAGAYSFANNVSVSGAITLTNQCSNSSGVTFSGTVDGTVAGSTYKNDPNTVTYYEPGVTTQPMNTGTLDVSANGNYFYYSRSNGQNVKTPASSYYHLYITGGAGTKTLAGNADVDGNLYIAASTSFNPNTFDCAVSGATSIFGTFADANAAGTTDLQSVDLSGGTISGSASGIVNVNGNITMPAGDGTIGHVQLTVTGTTTVADTRALTLSSNTGVKRFDGTITLSGSGSFTSTTVTTAANLDLRGGITVSSASGNFSAGAAVFNATQNITGAGTVSFDRATTIGAGYTVTNTCTGGVTFDNTITGTDAASTYAHGANGITYYQPAAITVPMNTGVLDMSASGNTFYYSRAGAQNVKVPLTSYYNLAITGGSSSTKTLQGNTTISNTLLIAASTELESSSHDISVGSASTIDGTFSDNNNGGTNTFTGLVDINASGSLTTANNSPFVFEGGITNDGTFSKTGTGSVSFNTNDQNIDGTATMTMAGNVTIAAGKTLTYKNTHTSGIILSGILDGANATSKWKSDVNSTVYYQPNSATVPMNTGILDASASGCNFYYSRTSGAQTLKTPVGGYYNLIISGGGGIIKTLSGNTTVEGNLTIAANTTLDVSAAQNYALTVKGNFLNSGTFLAQSGTVTLNGSTNQSLTTNGNSFYNLVVNNSATQISLNDDVTITNILTLTDGVITTGAGNRVSVNNSSASAITGYSSASFINGNLRRYIATNTSTYGFPLGNGTGSGNYYQADLINANLTGITYISSKFKPLSGHNDSQMNVSDTWLHGSLTYTTINTAGVWELEPNAAPSGGAYDIKLYIANMTGFTDNNFGPLKRPVGSVTGADWSTGGGTLNNNGNPGRTLESGYMYRSGLTGFSEFGGGGGSSSGGGLPIELVSFNAVTVGNMVQLNWETATEIENDFFTIERSADGETFSALKVIDGAGNSSQPKEYQTVDMQPLSGVSYYRLKQTDFNGMYSHSDVVSVTVNKEELFTISPNPVNSGRIALQLNQEEITGGAQSVTITDMGGKTVFYQNLISSGSSSPLSLELPAQLNQGIYVLTIKCLNSTLQKKFLAE